MNHFCLLAESINVTFLPEGHLLVSVRYKGSGQQKASRGVEANTAGGHCKAFAPHKPGVPQGSYGKGRWIKFRSSQIRG